MIIIFFSEAFVFKSTNQAPMPFPTIDSIPWYYRAVALLCFSGGLWFWANNFYYILLNKRGTPQNAFSAKLFPWKNVPSYPPTCDNTFDVDSGASRGYIPYDTPDVFRIELKNIVGASQDVMLQGVLINMPNGTPIYRNNIVNIEITSPTSITLDVDISYIYSENRAYLNDPQDISWEVHFTSPCNTSSESWAVIKSGRRDWSWFNYNPPDDKLKALTATLSPTDATGNVQKWNAFCNFTNKDKDGNILDRGMFTGRYNWAYPNCNTPCCYRPSNLNWIGGYMLETSKYLQ